MPVEIPVQITTTHQNRFWSPNSSDSDPDFFSGGSAFGSVMRNSRERRAVLPPRAGRRHCGRATAASAPIPARSTRIISEVTIGSAPVRATPRQPITGSRLAEIIAANMVPSATGTTIMLETKVRYRVGVISTISGFCAVTAAIDPKPTTKRSSENRIQAPSGISAHPAAPIEKISPPTQMIFLRPIRGRQFARRRASRRWRRCRKRAASSRSGHR